MRFIFYLIYLYYQKELILFMNIVCHCQYMSIVYYFEFKSSFNLLLIIYLAFRKIMKYLLVLIFFIYLMKKLIFLYQDLSIF